MWDLITGYSWACETIIGIDALTASIGMPAASGDFVMPFTFPEIGLSLRRVDGDHRFAKLLMKVDWPHETD